MWPFDLSKALFFDFGEGDLIGGNVDDFSVFPKDHRNAGSTVFEDGVAKGAVQSCLDGDIVIYHFLDVHGKRLSHVSIVSQSGSTLLHRKPGRPVLFHRLQSTGVDGGLSCRKIATALLSDDRC